jgi:hypothetical protein
VKRWQWALLIFELALFAVILILPQVDLPDCTFHGGNAPVVAKARLSAPPVRIVVAPVQPPVPVPAHELVSETHSRIVPPSSDSRLSVLCVRLC